MKLSEEKAKRCLTVAAWAMHEGKMLLVKHKKLGIWLAPGGHVEENELPHQAAEREFFEETGVIVEVISSNASLFVEGERSQFLPVPFSSNLHVINKPRGSGVCEQHYVFCYFARVIDLSRSGHQEE